MLWRHARPWPHSTNLPTYPLLLLLPSRLNNCQSYGLIVTIDSTSPETKDLSLSFSNSTSALCYLIAFFIFSLSHTHFLTMSVYFFSISSSSSVSFSFSLFLSQTTLQGIFISFFSRQSQATQISPFRLFLIFYLYGHSFFHWSTPASFSFIFGFSNKQQ